MVPSPGLEKISNAALKIFSVKVHIEIMKQTREAGSNEKSINPRVREKMEL